MLVKCNCTKLQKLLNCDSSPLLLADFQQFCQSLTPATSSKTYCQQTPPSLAGCLICCFVRCRSLNCEFGSRVIVISVVRNGTTTSQSATFSKLRIWRTSGTLKRRRKSGIACLTSRFGFATSNCVRLRRTVTPTTTSRPFWNRGLA